MVIRAISFPFSLIVREQQTTLKRQNILAEYRSLPFAITIVSYNGCLDKCLPKQKHGASWIKSNAPYCDYFFQASDEHTKYAFADRDAQTHLSSRTRGFEGSLGCIEL